MKNPRMRASQVLSLLHPIVVMRCSLTTGSHVSGLSHPKVSLKCCLTIGSQVSGLSQPIASTKTPLISGSQVSGLLHGNGPPPPPGDIARQCAPSAGAPASQPLFEAEPPLIAMHAIDSCTEPHDSGPAVFCAPPWSDAAVQPPPSDSPLPQEPCPELFEASPLALDAEHPAAAVPGAEFEPNDPAESAAPQEASPAVLDAFPSALVATQPAVDVPDPHDSEPVVFDASSAALPATQPELDMSTMVRDPS